MKNMKAKQPIVSVIIPVYNVEKYIDECLLSIVSQTIGIENIEVIVVNDCTPDNAMDIVKKYQNKYPSSFIVINNKENKGLGASRNLGLKEATGEFVAFVDSDDFLDKGVLKYGVDNLQKHNLNLFIYQFAYFREDTGEVFTKNITNVNYKKDDYIVKKKDIIHYPHIFQEVSTCNKMYRREALARDVFFTEGKRFEDMFFSLINICRSDIYFTNKVRYHYRKRSDGQSITDTSLTDFVSYSDQIEELLRVKEIGTLYPWTKFIVDWFLVYSWAYFLHHLLLDDQRQLTQKQKNRIFINTQKLWSDIDVDNLYDDAIDVRYKKMVRLSQLCDAYDDVAKLYTKKILLYKIYARLPKILKSTDFIKNNTFIKFIGEKFRKAPTKMGDFAPQIIYKKIRFFFVWQSIKREINKILSHNANRENDVWLFCERRNEARDNAFVFFQYMREKYPQLPAFYVIDKESMDYQKVKKYGNVLAYGSQEHKKYFVKAKYLISSHARGEIEPWRSDMLGWFWREYRKKKYIFLQHGVIPNDVSYILGRKRQHFDIFICGAKPEYDFILDQFGYDESVVKYTGLARYDCLHDTQAKHQILLMPTWRSELCQPSWTDKRIVKDEVFINSEYYKRFQDVINNKKLQEMLQKKNIELVFYPHFEVQQYLKYFYTDCDNIVLASKEKYDVQTLLKESKLLITDYSSVFFDFAYMHKPSVFYQFDGEHFFKEHYQKGYFDYRRDGFGDVVTEENDLINSIQKVVENNFAMEEKYYKRIGRFFPLHDKKNCERIYNEIVTL